jgi:hypothetical protein
VQKLIRPTLPLLLLLGLISLAESAYSVQTCRTESEIPSSTPSGDFTIHGDGTVTHHATGLMWMQCSLGQSGSDCATGSADSYVWYDALLEASASSFAGYTDWRLPNINELRSIVEKRCVDPAINETVFPAPASFYWSSSPLADYSNSAWGVTFGYFGYGHSAHSYRYSSWYVRLVRSGQ